MRKPLRFAESDAGKFARLLAELGEVNQDDIFLLQGRGLVEVEHALELASQKVALYHTQPDARVVLIFYYSGHSDGMGLELAGQKLSFTKLRERLAATQADVRLQILDACKSGQATQVKGGKPAPPFVIRLNDELNTSGEVILASSAADENTLESEEVKGSFFTHHLVSGLRGAADVSADGRVTLNEAYRYAYDRTISSSATTLEGPHHPVYDLRLSGQGELVLAYLHNMSAMLTLPTPFQRAILVQLISDQVIAELTSASATTIALPQGRYAVRINKDGEIFTARFTLKNGEQKTLAWTDLDKFQNVEVAVKKGETEVEVDLSLTVKTEEPAKIEEKKKLVEERSLPGFMFSFSGGIGSAIADVIDLGGSLRLSLMATPPTGWNVVLASSFAQAGNDEIIEGSGYLRFGYSLGANLGSLFGSLGLELGPGFVWQANDDGMIGSSLAFSFGPRISIQIPLSRSWAFLIDGELMMNVVKLDEKTTMRAIPAGQMGFAVGF
jgi:hypothetical protein